MKTSPARQLWFFLAMVGLFSAAASALKIHVEHPNPMLDRFSMWGPAAATAITCWVYGIDLRTLGWKWPARRWLTLSYLLPFLYTVPVYVAAWLFVQNSFRLETFMENMAGAYELAGMNLFATFGVGLPLLLTVGMISGLTWALGEELGWRGFLFPRLIERFGFNGACLAGGLIWAVWHYPMLLWSDYNAGTSAAFALPCFTLSVIAMSFVAGWLRLRTGSIWPPTLLHASHNLFVQAVFDPMTANTGSARLLTTEFGAGLTVTITITALLLCARRTPAPAASAR